jgi:hypothetical protein
MSLEGALRAALADVPGASVVVAAPGQVVTDIIEALRATDGEVVLLAIDPMVAAVDRAMLIGAVGPLAVELAPVVRIGALDVTDGAVVADIAAAAQFLATARSTTGQILKISPEN